MSDKNIDEFAKILVKTVRDIAIKNCKSRFDKNSGSPIAKAWVAGLKQDSIDQITPIIIPDCVDETLFCLLNAIDECSLDLMFRGADGIVTDLGDVGLSELAGWYVGSDSWRHRYSSEKINEY